MPSQMARLKKLEARCPPREAKDEVLDLIGYMSNEELDAFDDLLAKDRPLTTETDRFAADVLLAHAAERRRKRNAEEMSSVRPERN